MQGIGAGTRLTVSTNPWYFAPILTERIMEGLTIKTRPCGSFELSHDGQTWRVVHEVSFRPTPWVLVAVDDKSGPMRVGVFDSFGTIDEALAKMVDVASGGKECRFRVVLPCGASFLRPGRIPAEEVMFTLGWVHTKRLTGYMHLSLPVHFSPREARDAFRRRVRIPNSRVGDVQCLGRSDSESVWLADIHLDRDGFMRISEFQIEAAAAFAGIEGMLGSYDYAMRHPIRRSSEADVIAFPIDRVRQRPAA